MPIPSRIDPSSRRLASAPRVLLVLSMLATLVASPALPEGAAAVGDAADDATALRWHDDLTAAVAEAKEREARIFVDLFAEWCGWCHKLEDEVFTTQAFRDFVADENLVLLRVDTEDGAEGAVLYARYSGGSLPTSVVLDPDLVRIASVEGYAPAALYIESIRAKVDVWNGVIAGYQSVLEGDDVELQRELASDLHSRGDARRAAALYEAILPRVQDGTEAKAWMHYFLADSYRLQRRFDDAASQAARADAIRGKLAARRATEDGTDEASDVAQADQGLTQLAERIDLLSFYMAQDDGDCPSAVASLERFLRDHPKSYLRAQLRQTLQTLKNDPQCT